MKIFQRFYNDAGDQIIGVRQRWIGDMKGLKCLLQGMMKMATEFDLVGDGFMTLRCR